MNCKFNAIKMHPCMDKCIINGDLLIFGEGDILQGALFG